MISPRRHRPGRPSADVGGQNPVTPPAYGVTSLPTLLLFKDGAVVATRIGAVSPGPLQEFLDLNL
ncbi:hypothetical protein AB852_25915 [Streptomyces uncialis]|uniref:Thioredoxin domain-containing protein n=1 Tax=Streptomyces uncialis TaxID=1048205 RepID=A0A1Q4V3B8_9ACTN|nr:hypothetical protein AB852_25915 [Streptomyces uncialis]